jgi:transposase
MSTPFRKYDLDQPFLLPPDIRDWLPEGHLARFVDETVGELDLSEILRVYRGGAGGRPAYHPGMMVRLLIYAYCIGMPSSRRIEKATWEDVPTRVLAGNEHPDHDTISHFRKRHRKALANLFVQVLRLCQRSGLVKLGHVALDGTKVRANASKAKSSTYKRISEEERELAAKVDRLLIDAEKTDNAEDHQFGKGRRGDELPEELAKQTSRREKLREAKEQLEAEARERAAEEAAEQEKKRSAQEARVLAGGRRGRTVQVRDPQQAVPAPGAQFNFTDPESEIMRDGATKAFSQSYNAQIVVDAEHQIIVARAVTNQASDRPCVIPLIKQVQELTGRLPAQVSADAGCFSERNVTSPDLSGVDLHIPPAAPGKRKWAKAPSPRARTAQGPGAVAMRDKLATPDGMAAYAKRKITVEPVFGQIKHTRGFRMFSFRGLTNAAAEWDLICLTHNLLKLFRYGTGNTAKPGDRPGLASRLFQLASLALSQFDPGVPELA